MNDIDNPGKPALVFWFFGILKDELKILSQSQFFSKQVGLGT